MNGFREIPPWCISVVGAGLYMFWMALLAKAGGPNWVMVPSDLNYIYLFNGLNVLTGHPPGVLIHPATTVSFFFAVCTWVIHAVIGSGDLVRDVIQNAEFYMKSVNSIIVALNTAAMFALGQMVYRGTRYRSLILVAQGSFILCPALWLSFDSFGSPESFQTLFLVLLAGVTIATLQNGLPDQRSRSVYVLVTALVSGATIGTKFTSIPMLVLPLLTIPTLRWKAAFLGLTAISTVLFVSPVFLNWHQFLIDIKALTNMAANERGAVGAGSLLGALSTQARGLFSAMHLFSLILCLEIIGCLIIPAVGALRRPDLANSYHMYCAFVLTAVVTTCFVLIRPKPNYLGPYTVVLGIGFVLLVYMAGRCLSATCATGHSLRHIPNVAACAILVLYLAVGRFELTDSGQGVPLLAQIRDDAFKINRMVFPIPEDQALITAIQASNVYTAFDHANAYSHFVLAGTTAALTPSNRYNYLLDGISVVDRYWHRYSLHDLKTGYKKVYYWSTMGNFRRNEWRAPPDAILRNLFVGSAEKLAEVEAVAMPNSYDPIVPSDENSILGGSVGGCAISCRNVQISFGNSRDEVITYYELRAADSQAAQSMPLRWRVEASVDGSSWGALATVRDDKTWSAGETRTYRLENARPYRLYRFLEIGGNAGTTRKWPSHVKLYSAGSSVRRLLPSAASFVPRNALGFFDMVGDGFWEQKGAFPRELTAASDRPRRVWEYILGTGEHGIDATSRMPKSWTLYGSRDGQQWKEIDQREHSDEWKVNEKRVYSLSSPGVYRYFRMRINAGFHPSILRIYKLIIVGAWDDSEQSLERIAVRGTPFWERNGPFPIGVQLDFSTATKAFSYVLRTGPYGLDSTSRMPTEWQLFGSKDGRFWTSIDIQTGQSDWKNMQERTFQISDPDEYPHYRFVFRAANTSILRIEDIQLLGTQACPPQATALHSRNECQRQAALTGR
jgi:hypothetical protein